MFASPTVPRNPSRAKSEGRDPVEPRPSGYLCGYRSIAPSWLDSRDVIRLHALLALGLLVRDLGALIEALEAVAGYTRVVHEEIITALVGGDEAVALLVGKPLYRSLGHIWSPPFVFLGLHCNKNAAPLTVRAALLTHHKTHIFYCVLTMPRARPEPESPDPGGWYECPTGLRPPQASQELLRASYLA